MDIKLERLASLSARELQNYLITHVPHQTDRNLIRANVSAYKEQRRAEKIKKTTQEKLWGALLRDLKYERSNTAVGAAYKSKHPTPERDEAFAAYLRVLDKLLSLLEDNYKQQGITPSEMAKIKNVPNNGVHWTDWIPEHIKIKTTALFDGIPHRPKAKRKTPFTRTQRPDVKKLNRMGEKVSALDAMKMQVDDAMTTLRREMSILATEKASDTMTDLARVRDWLDEADNTTALPNTWHGVLRLIENGSD
jgi:hypothetical protein